jgi:hypothetical protein
MVIFAHLESPKLGFKISLYSIDGDFMKNYALLGFSLLLVSGATSALTMTEKKFKTEWDAKVKTYGSHDLFKKNCGGDLSYTFDDKLVTSFVKDNANAATYADQLAGAMARMCEDATVKKALSSKVKKMALKGAAKNDEASFKMSGSELVVTLGPSAPNLEDKVKEFLENNL